MESCIRFSFWALLAFTFPATAAAQVQLLAQSTPGNLNGDDVSSGGAFGRSVAIDGDTIVIGSPSTADVGADSGAVYVFVRGTTSWSLQTKLVAELPGDIPDATAGDRFGFALALDGDTLVVGAPGHEQSIDPCVPAPLDPNTECPDCAYGAVYVFQRSGTTWTADQLLVASDRDKLDQFGYSVAITQDAIVVGAPFEDDFTLVACDPPLQVNASTCDAGAAYVFENDGTAWVEVTKLGAGSDAEAGASFGHAVAIDLDVIVVGAPRKHDITGTEQSSRVGAAYVFEKSGTAWDTAGFALHDHSLSTLDLDAFDAFGTSVAVHLGTIAVGAPHARGMSITGVEASSGAVHVFADTSSGWTLQSRLTAENARETAAFGASVALAGDTLCVGAPHANDESTRTGFAHVFQRIGESWNEEPSPRPTQIGLLDRFGNAVDVTGSAPATVVVGSWLADPTGAPDAGTAWIFDSEVSRPFCFGSNGSGACGSCPCGNDAPPGTRGGCLNANPVDGFSWSGGTGSSALLIAQGTPSVSANQLHFTLSSARETSFAVLISATSPLPNPTQPCPSGIGIQSVQLDGLRCIGMGVVRHATVPLDVNGDSVATGNPANGWGPPNGPPQGLMTQAGVTAGQTRLFQTHYRELPNAVCSTGQNTSNAIAITAVP